eukprot:c9826_g1_i1 orf=115-393(+)
MPSLSCTYVYYTYKICIFSKQTNFKKHTLTQGGIELGSPFLGTSSHLTLLLLHHPGRAWKALAGPDHKTVLRSFAGPSERFLASTLPSYAQY